MKTFKYYRLPKTAQIPYSEDAEVFDYAIDGSDKIIGVKTEDHSLFDLTEAAEQSFEEVSEILGNCHLNKELNKNISKRIREQYSVDDEIALLKKNDTDAKKIAYNEYVDAIKTEINSKKIEYGLREL